MDKMSITRVLTGKNANEHEHDRINNFVGGASYDVPGAKNWKHAKHNWTYTRLPLDERNYLTIGYGYAHQKMRATFQFNPGQLSLDGFAQLKAYVDPLIDGGLASLLNQSSVGNVEFALDVDHIEFQKYIFIDTRMRSVDATYEDLGTMYIGADSSKRRLRIYDKEKQLKNKEKVAIGHARLRIEAILDKPLCTVAQLPLIENPFKSLLVVERAALLHYAQTPELEEFLTLMMGGKTAQAAYLLAGNRAKLKMFLAGIQAPWWPEAMKLWEKAGEAVSWTGPFTH